MKFFYIAVSGVMNIASGLMIVVSGNKFVGVLFNYAVIFALLEIGFAILSLGEKNECF